MGFVNNWVDLGYRLNAIIHGIKVAKFIIFFILGFVISGLI